MRLPVLTCEPPCLACRTPTSAASTRIKNPNPNQVRTGRSGGGHVECMRHTGCADQDPVGRTHEARVMAARLSYCCSQPGTGLSAAKHASRWTCSSGYGYHAYHSIC